MSFFKSQSNNLNILSFEITTAIIIANTSIIRKMPETLSEFDSHSHPMSLLLLRFHFTDEETEA